MDLIQHENDQVNQKIWHFPEYTGFLSFLGDRSVENRKIMRY